MQIDGRNYVAPGAFVPGGDPSVVYVTSDSLVNIELNFPAADNPGCRARDNVNKIDVVSEGGAWVPDINVATDFSVIDDTKVPTVQAVENRLSTVDPAIESITLFVIPGGTNVQTGAPEFSFRLPRSVELSDIRAYMFDDNFISGDVEIDVLNNGVSILTTHLFIDQGNKSSFDNTGPALLPNPTHSPTADIASPIINENDEITFDVIDDGNYAKGLTIILLGTRV